MMPTAAKRRVTIDLNGPSIDEMAWLEEQTGMSTAELCRKGIGLLGVCLRAKQLGKEFQVVNPGDPKDKTVVELCIPVREEE